MSILSHSSGAETMMPYLTGKASKAALPELAPEYARASFNALLYPNRSLPNTGFKIVMGIIIAANLLSGVLYSILGAWPVIIFCGLDVVLVWLAFKISYAQARLHERVVLIDDRLIVSRVLASGHESRWSLPAYWVRLEYHLPMQHEDQVCLRLFGKVLFIGSFLSPAERGDLAQALEAALHKQRRMHPNLASSQIDKTG